MERASHLNYSQVVNEDFSVNERPYETMMVRQGHRTGRQQGQEGLAALPWLAGGFCPLVTVCFPPSGTWEILAKVGTSE